MEKAAEFPAGLTPSDLPSDKADTTSLVWDFTTNDGSEDQTKDYVKVYLKAASGKEGGDDSSKKEANGDTTSEGQTTEATSATATNKPTNSTKDESSNSEETIEASVLQYQRQLRKTQAAKKAGAILTDDQLEIVFEDDCLVVVNKPAGVLCVPGINNNDSIANLLFARIRKQQQQSDSPTNDLCPDACSMAVHRLDMDTSGLVVFGKTKATVSSLHQVFRRETPQESKKKRRNNRKRKKRQKTGEAAEGPEPPEEEPIAEAPVGTVVKEYEALVCGHLPLDISSGHVNLPLQRDVHHPPFMRVSTPHSEALARQVVDELRARNWTKLSKRNPKQSQTTFRVLGREYYNASSEEGEEKGIPVTRLSLTPITGRTHQLRVHCAAMGFPIVGDPVYGIYGESAFCGGLFHNSVQVMTKEDGMEAGKPWRAPISLQKQMMEAHPLGENDMCLHAKKLGFPHPITKVMGEWEVSPKF